MYKDKYKEYKNILASRFLYKQKKANSTATN